MIAREIGATVGAVILFLAVFIAFIFARKCKANTEHYDERQMAVRGKGYQYTSMTMLIMLFLYGGFYGFLKDIVSPQFVVFAIGFLGVVIYSVYCIINDAYLQVGQNPKKWIVLVIFVIVSNLFCALQSSERGLTINGFATSASLNILIVVSFVAVLVTLLIKYALDKRGDSNEES